MSVENPTTSDRVRWICHTSAEDGRNEVKHLLQSGKPAETLAILEDALAEEQRFGARKSLSDAIAAGIRKCRTELDKQASIPSGELALPDNITGQAPSPAGEIPRKGKSRKTETSTPEQNPVAVLGMAKARLETLRAELIEAEEVFFKATLPQRLKIGLNCLQAYMLFCIKDPADRGQGRKPKTIKSQRDVISQGFEVWLENSCPWLKKPTAYKYMTALKGLGLDWENTEEDVEEAVRQNLRIGPCTLKSLCDAAAQPVTPQAAPPPQLQQTEFEFLRDSLAAYREQSEHVLALKEQLEASPDMYRAACARAYATLSALTGTQWKPSDEPDELALVDPDTLSL